MTRTERVARYCGPAVVASASGLSREEAAERLLEIEPRRRGAFYAKTVNHVLGWRLRYRYSRPCWPTLAQWLRDHSEGEYIILASHHFIHVKDGEVLEDNGRTPMRGRVLEVLGPSE